MLFKRSYFSSALNAMVPEPAERIRNPQRVRPQLLLLFDAQLFPERWRLSGKLGAYPTALSLLSLNSPPPSVLQSTAMESVLSWNAIFSIPVNMILNSVGARTQPCFTPLVTSKEFEDSPSTETLAWRDHGMQARRTAASSCP